MTEYQLLGEVLYRLLRLLQDQHYEDELLDKELDALAERLVPLIAWEDDVAREDRSAVEPRGEAKP